VAVLFPSLHCLRGVRGCLLVSALCCGWPAAAENMDLPAIVTILDGDATVISGADRLGAALGLRLSAGTIIETAQHAALMRIELRDGAAIDLGPDTRAMLMPYGARERDNIAPALYLLQGWAKVSTPPSATVIGLLSPALATRGIDNVEVAYAGGNETWLFVETGTTELTERPADLSPLRLTLEQGAFYARLGSENGSVSRRPSKAMLEHLPRAFRDTLPLRAAVYRGRDVQAKTLSAATYAQLQAWLSAEPALRRDFPQRFGKCLLDPEFRSALVANIAAHPEWSTVLTSVELAARQKSPRAPKAGGTAARIH